MLEITSKTRTLGGRTVELIKQEYFRNSHQLSRIQSPLAASETNDCMVRGIMFGLDCSYEQAHQLVKTKLNRSNRKIKVMTKISLVIQNHLSDALLEINHPQLAEIGEMRINYVKYLIAKYPDTTVRIEDSKLDDMWEMYCEAQWGPLN